MKPWLRNTLQPSLVYDFKSHRNFKHLFYWLCDIMLQHDMNLALCSSGYLVSLEEQAVVVNNKEIPLNCSLSTFREHQQAQMEELARQQRQQKLALLRKQKSEQEQHWQELQRRRNSAQSRSPSILSKSSPVSHRMKKWFFFFCPQKMFIQKTEKTIGRRKHIGLSFLKPLREKHPVCSPL